MNAHGRASLEQEVSEMKKAALMEADSSADLSLGEIEREMSHLRRNLQQLEDNVHRLIERTAPVAAMERSIPPEGEPTTPDSAVTEMGRMLVDMRNHVQYLSDRVNEHNYRLELP